MQRPSSGTPSTPAPLTPAAGTGYYVPGGFAAVPGQTLLPTAVTRAWPTLAELINALKRRMVLATFLGILIGVASAAAVWLAVPSGKHQVKALVQMKPYNPIVGKAGPDGEFESYKQTQMKLMRTRTLLTRVVGDPQVSRLSLIQTSDDPVRMVDEQLRMRWESPELLEVAMQGDDPAQMQVIVNRLLELYKDDAANEDGKQRRHKQTQLQEMKEKYTKEIDGIEQRLKHGIKMGAGPTAEGNQLQIATHTTELNRINAALGDCRQKATILEIQTEANRRKLGELKGKSIDQADLQKALQDVPAVKNNVAEQDRVRRDLGVLLKLAPEESPQVQALKTKLTQLETDLKGVIEQYGQTVEPQLRASREKTLTDQIAKDSEELAIQKDLAKKLETQWKDTDERIRTLNQVQLATLENDELKAKKELRAKVQLELDQLELADRNDIRVSIREKAEPVINQNLKQKLLLAGAAALIGAGLIAVAVAFLEWRSRRVDSVDQIVNELGVRVIGTIPAFPSKASLRSGDAATNQNWRFVLNESVNSTRTMLLHAAKTQNMQVLMVTSAMQGEGKTSFASQLATSMATAGMRTLVLDTDLRNPSLHKLFDAPLTPGCSEVLCQEIDVSDAVQPTAIPNLWLIPAGQCSNRVIAALAQGHPLESLFNRLRGQFDFIVVDSCPILPVADALLVGQHVDGVVLSVLQDISQLPKVQTASEKLTQLNIPLLGAVVNGIKPDVHAYGYNYVKQLPA